MKKVVATLLFTAGVFGAAPASADSTAHSGRGVENKVEAPATNPQFPHELAKKIADRLKGAVGQ